jgi:hypothetical protein
MLYVPGSSFPPPHYPHAQTKLVRTEDLAGLNRGSPVATMYVSSTGGAIRRLIGSAHRHVISVRRDPQMAYGQPTEGIAEGPAVMRCATDPDIGYYQTQPFRIVLPFAGTIGSYIADLAYVTRDGSVWIREVKRTPADLAKPQYVAKLEAVNRLLSRLGWKFQPWTLKQIKGSAERQVNTGIIYYDRGAHLDDLLPRFERMAAETDRTTYGDLIRELDPRNTCRARAAVHRLIMKGRVWADMDSLIEDWSEVHLRAPSTAVPDLPFA